MAKVRTPLLSFGASGKLARTLTFFAWKGIDVAREYVIPTNPRTSAQTTQRDLFTACVYAWRNYVTDSAVRAAWNLLASAGKYAMSGFNRFQQSTLHILGPDPDASYATAVAAAAGNTVDFTMSNMDDGATGDEAGNFEVWVGDKATNLLKFEDQTISTGTISTSDLGDTGDIKYVELRKGGYSRSGIAKVTLIA